MEIAQAFHHLFTGKYLSYVSPKVARKAKGAFFLAPLDEGIRKTISNFLKILLRNPWVLAESLHLQSIMITQPIDVLTSGQQDMCDGCPDVTPWNGRLVWSCRLEELLKFGSFVNTVPKSMP
jgi:hypothetical protein